MVTGEPMPVEKGPGARVTGGTVNGTGGFVMRAERVGAETLLAQIVRMVAEAQRSRAPIQRLADLVSAWFVPAVVAVGGGDRARVGPLRARAAAGLCPGERRRGADHRVPLRAGPGHAHVDHGGHRPGRAGRRADQERRGARDAGEGRHAGGRQDGHADRGQARAWSPSWRRPGSRRRRCCALAAGLERGSEHPLAAAILAGAAERNVAPPRPWPSSARSPGGGDRRGRTGGGWRWATPALLEELGVEPGPLAGRAEALRAEGQTVMFLVAVDDAVAGILGVADPIKPSTPEAIRLLQAEGLRVIMLTGDSRITAQAVARALGISTMSSRKCCRSRRSRWCDACTRRAGWWPWPATASTMRRRWRRRTWASPWAPARMSRWRAPA